MITFVGDAAPPPSPLPGVLSLACFASLRLSLARVCACVQHRLELVPGMTFTIEPIFTEGSEATTLWPDAWTVQTLDGGRAAQFEHVVLITEEGHEVLTVPSQP